jgi:hypothetical protein
VRFAVGESLKLSLLRAALAAVATLPIAGGFFWVWFGVLASPDASLPVALRIVVVFVVSTVVAGFAAVIALVLSQWPGFGRRGLLRGTLVSLLMSGIIVYNQLHDGEPLTGSVHVFMWLIVWPGAFFSSLWWDLRWAMYRYVRDRVWRRR